MIVRVMGMVMIVIYNIHSGDGSGDAGGDGHAIARGNRNQEYPGGEWLISSNPTPAPTPAPKPKEPEPK